MIQQSHKKRLQTGMQLRRNSITEEKNPVWGKGKFLRGSDVWAESYRTTGVKAGEGR